MDIKFISNIASIAAMAFLIAVLIFKKPKRTRFVNFESGNMYNFDNVTCVRVDGKFLRMCQFGVWCNEECKSEADALMKFESLHKLLKSEKL